MNQGKIVLIIAGGSGGHVFPGLSVACFLINQGYTVVWLGTKDHIESKLVSRFGIDIKFISIQGYRGKKIYKKVIVLLFLFFLSMYQSLRIIRYWKPDIALSMGGYVSGPSGLMVWLCGIPLVIHEQNRVVGLANRYLSFFAEKVLQGFPGTIKGAMTSGNPLRYTVLSVPAPSIRWKNRIGPIRVLVIGGSNGASIFNHIIPQVFQRLSNKLIIWHQSGMKEFKYVTESYRKIQNNNCCTVTPFIYNIAQAYEWADIIISRSGALTVSEITCVGLPAIFVPFEHHKDRQQYLNAVPLVQLGAAIIVEQKQFTADYVSMILISWNRKILLNMANRAKTLAMPNSTQCVAKVIMECLHEKLN